MMDLTATLFPLRSSEPTAMVASRGTTVGVLLDAILTFSEDTAPKAVCLELRTERAVVGQRLVVPPKLLDPEARRAPDYHVHLRAFADECAMVLVSPSAGRGLPQPANGGNLPPAA